MSVAWPGWAWLGSAWRGAAGLGVAWRGKAKQRKVFIGGQNG